MTKEEQRLYNKTYYQNNKAKILADRKERYAHDEEYRQAIKNNVSIYRENNPETIKQSAKKFRASNKEKLDTYYRKYYARNKELISNKRKKKRGEREAVSQ